MIAYTDLLKALLQLPTHPFQGRLFRRVTLAALQCVKPYQFLFALGAGRMGARFTPKNGPASLYVAGTELTAEAEFKQQSFTAFQKSGAPPSVVYTLNVHLSHVLDLTDPKTHKKLHTNITELLAPWRLFEKNSPTQNLGLAAFQCRKITALKYPSSKLPGGFCFVIFTERLDGISFVELFDPEKVFFERIPMKVE